MPKWTFLSDFEKNIIFEDYKLYHEYRKNSNRAKAKDVLVKLFDYYNENVNFSYAKVNSAVSCGKCVQSILTFFKREFEKWEREQS